MFTLGLTLIHNAINSTTKLKIQNIQNNSDKSVIDKLKYFSDR